MVGKPVNPKCGLRVECVGNRHDQGWGKIYFHNRVYTIFFVSFVPTNETKVKFVVYDGTFVRS